MALLEQYFLKRHQTGTYKPYNKCLPSGPRATRGQQDFKIYTGFLKIITVLVNEIFINTHRVTKKGNVDTENKRFFLNGTKHLRCAALVKRETSGLLKAAVLLAFDHVMKMRKLAIQKFVVFLYEMGLSQYFSSSLLTFILDKGCRSLSDSPYS